MLLSADTGRDAVALATPENSHTRSEHIALLHGRRDVKRWWSADTLGIQRGPRLTDCRSDVAASSLRALFGSAQPKSRLHTSHVNDIIHAPHQSRAVSNHHQPTYCKIFCVRRYAKKSALNTPQSATVLFFNISEVSRWRTYDVDCRVLFCATFASCSLNF